MIPKIAIGFGLLFGLNACANKVAECKATTDRVYKQEMAACKDDACKQAAEKKKKDFYEACDNQK